MVICEILEAEETHQKNPDLWLILFSAAPWFQKVNKNLNILYQVENKILISQLLGK